MPSHGGLYRQKYMTGWLKTDQLKQCDYMLNNKLTLTWYCSSSKVCRFVNYSCLNLCRITPKYSLRPRFEYLHFRQIWRIHLEAKQISSNYLCFPQFVVHSWIIIQLLCIKYLILLNYKMLHIDHVWWNHATMYCIFVFAHLLL